MTSSYKDYKLASKSLRCLAVDSPDDEAKSAVTKILESSRNQAQMIIRELRDFDTRYDQEKHLLKSFIAHMMPNALKRTVVCKHFFSNNFSNMSRYSRKQMMVEYASVILLPLIVIVILLFVFLQGVFIGNNATAAWLTSLAVCLAVDLFLFKPLKIWINWIASGSYVEEEARACLGILRDRSKFLLRRSKGSLKHCNNVIQHFNPVCRVARYYPHFPISRLIMSLNDFDFPLDAVVSRKALWFRIECYFSASLLTLHWLWTNCPTSLQDTINDIVVTSFLGFLVLCAAYIISIGFRVMCIVILGCITIMVLLREICSHNRRLKFNSYIAPIETTKASDLDHIIRSEGLLEMRKWISSFYLV